jgi:hypothetical protein
MRAKEVKLCPGILTEIAPTMLEILGLSPDREKPDREVTLQ